MHNCGTGSFRFVYISQRSELDSANMKCETKYAHENDVLLNMKIPYQIKYLKTPRVNKTLFDHIILNIFDCAQ